MVAQACSSQLLGRGELKNLFEASLGKKFTKTHFNQQARHGGARNPSYVEVIGRKIKVQSWP
jgi:hypothetical protein